MSLLHEQDYVVSHLRAAYLQSFQDGVGDRVIKPSHLYITKTGPADLNWAANTLLSIAVPSSPPIPVDSFNDRVAQFQRGKLTSRGSSRKLSAKRSLLKRARSATVDDTSSTSKLLQTDQPENHQSPQNTSVSRPESLTDRLNMVDLLRDESDDDDDDDDDEIDDDDDDDELENGFRNYENNYQDELRALEGSPDDDIFNHAIVRDTGDYFSDSDALSPMSEEDDSMLDEDLEYAARQMKARMEADESASLSVPSFERSPRRRATTTSSSSSGYPSTVGKATGRRVTTSETTAWDKSNISTAAHQRRMSAPNRPRKILFDKEKPKLRVTLDVEAFSKHAVDASTVQKSALSSLIKIKQATFDNPLEEYISASGKSERNPLLIKMYMPSCSDPKKPWDVLIRRDVNIKTAIGFALYCYRESKRMPPLANDMLDPNKWNMHIVEDDGEPDDDFPALDRTRLISTYSFDEFALVHATPSQVIDNERITPNSKKSFSRDAEGVQDKEEAAESITPSLVNVYRYPFDVVLSKPIWSSELQPSTAVLTILEDVCKKNDLGIDRYVLKTANTRQLVYPKMTVGQLDNCNLELTPRRIITTTNGFSSADVVSVAKGTFLGARPSIKPLPSTSSFGMRSISMTSNKAGATGSILGTGILTNAALMNNEILPGSLGAAGYEKYTVWRRQPMSFISRHERVLAIDGDYIHIMPSEEKTFFDSPKTSSFHINQVLKCKQSRKVPANFKIVVMKTTGPKRYDLEAQTAALSATIVDRIRTLAGSFKGSGQYKRDLFINMS